MYINFSPSKPFKSGAPSLSSTSKIQFSSQRVNETFQKVKTPVSKNVLLVTDSWSPQIDGLATTAKNLAKNLRINGHNVLVIHPYLFPNIPSPSGYPGARLTFPKGLNTKIKNFKPDWAINLTPEYSLGIMSSAILKRNKIPYVT
nr:hypothetical protein [Vampirovibrio sp.]